MAFSPGKKDGTAFSRKELVLKVGPRELLFLKIVNVLLLKNLAKLL